MSYDSDGKSDVYDVSVELLDNLIFNETNCDDQVMNVQRAALGLSQGSVKSFLASSTGQWAVPQLQSSQVRELLQEELLQRN